MKKLLIIILIVFISMPAMAMSQMADKDLNEVTGQIADPTLIPFFADPVAEAYFFYTLVDFIKRPIDETTEAAGLIIYAVTPVVGARKAVNDSSSVAGSVTLGVGF